MGYFVAKLLRRTRNCQEKNKKNRPGMAMNPVMASAVFGWDILGRFGYHLLSRCYVKKD